MKTNLKLHLLLLTLLSLAGFAHAQGTAIGYQGRLNDDSLPATGLYDFTFTLFYGEADVTVGAGPLVLAAVPVTNGLFNVILDFGPDIFSGPARWLEITVRASGVGVPILLTPRTPLLPAPYSIFAGSAADVVSGSVVKSLNTLKDDVTLTAGENVTITPDGNTLTITAAGAGGSGIWSVTNNNAYYNSGNVGIGTTTPTNKLTVSTPTLEYGIEHTDGDIRLGTFVGRATGYLGTLSDHTLTFFANDNGLEDMTMSLIPGGNVGIGTATPARKLTIRTPGYGFEHTDGHVRLGTYLNSTGGWLGTVSDHPLKFFVNDGVAPSMTIDGSGTTMALGLGTVVVGSPNGESGLSIVRGGNRADVRFEGTALKMVVGPVGGPPASTRGIAIDTDGNVGIGTADPQVKLDVRGAGVLESTVWSVNERAILSLNSTLGGQNRIWTLESGVFGTPGLFGIYDRTAGRAGLTIDTAGVVSVAVLRITGGADLAEPFQMKEEELAKGSVVVIDDEHPGRLKRSRCAYDTRVAGIISGANGVNPGIALHQEGVLEGGQNVALSGRVYVQADAAFGAIKPGDLLTTSDTPGHAMKVTEPGKAQGAILGKAMSALKEGTGLVLVLVTLQ
jgi:hypothetical protein